MQVDDVLMIGVGHWLRVERIEVLTVTVLGFDTASK
jgi:hypothetical protein